MHLRCVHTLGLGSKIKKLKTDLQIWSDKTSFIYKEIFAAGIKSSLEMCSVYHQYCFSDWIHHLVMESHNEIQHFFPFFFYLEPALLFTLPLSHEE